MLGKLLLIFSLLKPVFMPVQNASFDFVVVGDTQSRKHLTYKLIKNINNRKKLPEFGIHLGDMDYAGYKYLWKKSSYRFSKSKIPWHYVIGNHELYNYLPYSYTTRRMWSDFWYGNEGTLREFIYGGKTFIILDNATKYMPSGHLFRLTNVLKEAKDNSVFIFAHRPFPYPRNFWVRYGPGHKFMHRYTDMMGVRYRHRNILLWHTLKRYKKKILGMFHGHYHAYRSYSLDGIPVYCSGGGGGTLETSRDFHHFLLVKIRRVGVIVKVIRL